MDDTRLMTDLAAAREVFWLNPRYDAAAKADTPFSRAEVDDAAERLRRFAPVTASLFPETEAAGGIIESPLVEIPAMRERLGHGGGRLYLKQDSHLPVSGSVKARGGIYEVLKHTETLALENGILTSPDDDRRKLLTPEARAFFGTQRVQVGSTGNLGLSIGIMGAALGFDTIVHMSADAKQWKKDLLRRRGATVIEYAGAYSEAVRHGRELSDADPCSYFVDDEHSRDLFLGYAVAGRRLKDQLAQQDIPVDGAHPLYVYIPCGVGGAPGGITYGLKQEFGKDVHIFFAEPTQAACMLLGLASGKFDGIAVTDIGLTGRTAADGLAVGRCSSLAARAVDPLLSGEATIEDNGLTPYLKALWETERIFIEPSACAAFRPYDRLRGSDPNASHIIWATGGSMMPAELQAELIK